MHLVASSPSSARRAARVLSGLSLPQAMGATVAILVFAIAARPALDPDLWWHLRSGHWMLDHHAILRADPFSHTRRGVVREPTDWLSELALYGAWAAAGLAGVAFLVAAIASAGSALLLRACRGSLAVRFASVVLAAAASSVFWSARPQMATYLGCVVVVVLMVQLRAGRLEPHRLAWLVPLFALWSNLHLGWFYGLGIVGGTLVGEWIERARGRSGLPPDAFRALAAALLASCGAVMLNPVGPRVWTTALTQIRVGRSFIEENQPPRLSSVMAFPFFVLLVAVVAVLVARRHHLSATDVLLVAGTGVAALTAVRAVPLFATVATPVLAIHLSELLASRSARRPARNRTARDLSPRHAAVLHLVVVVLLAGVVVTQVRAEQRPEAVAAQEARELPVAAARWIEANHPGGALLNPFDWGGYLIWALPSYPVSIDGRADLYADDLAHYQALLDGRTWRDQFARQQIGVVLLPPDAGLVRALQVDGGWRIAFRDRTAVVLVPDGR